MELNEGLIQAQQQLKEAYENSQLRNEAQHKEYQEKIKEDKAKKDAYFSSMYLKQNMRVYRMREILKVDWSDK